MQRLHYTGESFLVADEVCSALMDYASALADAGRSDVVSILIVDEAGLQIPAELLIGPASQLYSTSVDHMREEGLDSSLVADMRARAAALRSSAPSAGAVASGESPA